MSVQLSFRVSEEQAEALREAAKGAGLPLGQWLREVSLRAARRADLADSRKLEGVLGKLIEAGKQ